MRLGTVGRVEAFTVENDPDGVSLEARVRVGSRSVDYRAKGTNLIEAYAALTHGIASVARDASSTQ